MVSVRRLRHRGSHEIVLGRTATNPRQDVIVKRPRRRISARRRAMLCRRAAVEHHVLTEIAPAITAKDPALRCPRVLGYEPDAGVLVLERVDGDSLQSMVFGFGRAPGRERIAHALRQAAEWLARLHEVTRSRHERNAFDWVLAELALGESRQVFLDYAGAGTHRELGRLAARFRREHRQFQRPLCRIHGTFLPYHVLADAASVCVIDLEASRPGFPYEDLGLLFAAYDLYAPWRRRLAERRMTIAEQIQLCWRSYSGSDEPPAEAEARLRRFTRLLGMARFVALSRRARYGEDAADPAAVPVPLEPRARALRSRLLEPWWRYRFRAACRQELDALGHA